MGGVGKSCRLCQSKDELCVSIFGEYSMAKRLAEKMESCLQLRVHQNDANSEFVCYECIHKLETFSEFKNRVKISLRSPKENKELPFQVARRRQTECSDFFRVKKDRFFQNAKPVNRKMAGKENDVSRRSKMKVLDIFDSQDDRKVESEVSSSPDEDREDFFTLTPDVDFIFKLHQ